MPYSDTFCKALTFTLKWEGGYVNNCHDKGGPTNYGITQQVYDDYRNKNHKDNIPVKMIHMDEVKNIYFAEYWTKAGCYSMPIKLAIAVFDFAVNSGVSRALRYLEQSTNQLETYLQAREQYFRTIGKGSNSIFLKGWLNRLKGLRNYLGTI